METSIKHICNLLSFPATSFRRRQSSSTKSGLTRLLLACFGSRLLQGLLLRLIYRKSLILLVRITNQRIKFIFKSTSSSRSLNDILLFTSPQILRKIVQVMTENYADNDHSTTKDTRSGLSWYCSAVAVAGAGRREQVEVRGLSLVHPPSHRHSHHHHRVQSGLVFLILSLITDQESNVTRAS